MLNVRIKVKKKITPNIVSLGRLWPIAHQTLKVRIATEQIRLLQTFAGVLQKKKIVRVLF